MRGDCVRSIRFACRALIALTPDEIVEEILDLDNWPAFQGYGPLPGIRSAEFEVQTPHLVGTRIRVTNLDGSTHVEEIVEWQPDRLLRLRMHEFSLPVSRLATEFMETWEFQPDGGETRVVRHFELHAKSLVAWPILWLISSPLKRAVARHLSQMIRQT